MNRLIEDWEWGTLWVSLLPAWPESNPWELGVGLFYQAANCGLLRMKAASWILWGLPHSTWHSTLCPCHRSCGHGLAAKQESVEHLPLGKSQAFLTYSWEQIWNPRSLPPGRQIKPLPLQFLGSWAVPGQKEAGTGHAVPVLYPKSRSMALWPWGTTAPSEPQRPIIVSDRAPLWKADTGLEWSSYLSSLFFLPFYPQPSSFLPCCSQLKCYLLRVDLPDHSA